MPLDWASIIRALTQYDPKEPMIPPTLTFWVWCIIVLGVYGFMLQVRREKWGFLWILAFSIFFYYKCVGSFIIVFILTLIGEYFLVKWMMNSPRFSRVTLAGAVVLPLFLLGYYKYTGFLLQNWAWMTGYSFEAPDIILPAGISFYTFQMISYAVDVKRGHIPVGSFWDYALYIAYFPQLVAGPIVRAGHFLPQLQALRLEAEWIGRGFWLVLQGLVKKVVFADYIAQYNDLIFSNPKGYSGFENLMAIYGYGLQIFLDFSGYSDVAIGIGRMMGFDLGVNFSKPYLATNISEFWRRWHISLSSWLRDYLYIPLGGNRKGEGRTYVNLLLTMLIGGLWHGASWRFVVWGGVHGVALAVHRWLFGKDTSSFSLPLWRRIVGWFLTFHLVLGLWVFFRAPSFHTAIELLSKAIKPESEILIPFIEARALFIILLIIGYLLHIIPMKRVEWIERSFAKSPWLVKLAVFIVVVQLILEMRQSHVRPFIYFQF
ncbi:MAG: MBOAT family O-acyltransferase [Bacteroidia bacterium]|nr:MBOAT family protein [Bacteroidia bacterium]MDW8133953.1 MBOAT family O-acyltransferase [Bacteroidia bacterium]